MCEEGDWEWKEKEKQVWIALVILSSTYGPVASHVPSLSFNHAEQTNRSACYNEPASLGFDCCSSDGCLQLIKILPQLKILQTYLDITAIVATNLRNCVILKLSCVCCTKIKC